MHNWFRLYCINHMDSCKALPFLIVLCTVIITPQKNNSVLSCFIIKEQASNREFFGNAYHDNDYVFTGEDGRPYDPDYISKLFCKATAAYGRPEITLHKLRHTCASLLINKGWDVKKLPYWLGHSDTSTTLNIYSHFNKERLNEMPDDLEQLSESCAELFGA